MADLGERGSSPRWRRDGKEIFYVAARRLWAVTIASRPGFTPGVPTALFEKRGMISLQFDVSPDGKRFILLEMPAGEPPLAIHVVHNWFEEFRNRR